MTTDIEIANMGILKCRGNTISSFADDQEEAEIASDFYPMLINYIFSIYPWTFAKKKVQASRLTGTPVNKWTYKFARPSDAVFIHAIYSSSNVGARPIQDFEIVGNEIHTDHPTIYIEYTTYVSESYWPGYFQVYAYTKFAEMICMTLTDDEDLMTRLQREAEGTPEENGRGGLFARAASQDSKQTPPEEIESCELEAARFSG